MRYASVCRPSGIYTASTSRPPLPSKRYFTVPSTDRAEALGAARPTQYRRDSVSRAFLDKFVISSTSAIRLTYSQSAICRAANRGIPLDAVLDAITVLTSPWGLAWSPKRITVSTIGKITELKRLLDETAYGGGYAEFVKPVTECRHRRVIGCMQVTVGYGMEPYQIHTAVKTFQQTGAHIKICNFKNIADAELDFSPKVNCFLGNNGMGKSNLLDAAFNPPHIIYSTDRRL